MSYIPLYPQSFHPSSPSSIWAPNQPTSVSSISSRWPRMPTRLLSYSEQLSKQSRSTKFMSKGPDIDGLPNIIDDRDCEDVFGPIMSNDSRANSPQILGIKRDVGAIGDRRKRDEPRGGLGNVVSDSRSNFSVDQMLRNLNITPSLPAAPLLHHPKANRIANFPLEESPSASSSSSSPGAVDVLQTPSDNSPVTPRSPHGFDIHNDKTRLTPSSTKIASMYAFEPDYNEHSMPVLSRNAARSLVPATYRGLTPNAPLNAPYAITNPFSSSPPASLSSSDRPYHTHSFPLVETVSPSPALHHASFSHASPSSRYTGDFNPFANDFSPGSSPQLFHPGFLKSNDNVPEAVSSWSQTRQSQTRPFPYSNINEDWPAPHPTFIHSNAEASSPPMFLSPAQRRLSLEAVPEHLLDDGQHSALAHRPGAQGSIESQYHRFSLGPVGITAAGLGFAGRDMVHGLGITGLGTASGERDNLHAIDDRSLGSSPVYANVGSVPFPGGPTPERQQGNEPINFLHLLSPTAAPPYSHFITRIVKSSDQQASIFLQQKLKIADAVERRKIIDAVSQRGVDMMTNRFGNWAVQRCLEPPCETVDRMKIVNCMRGRIVELATNCYGTHVLQKALDCEEEVRLLIVSELLLGDPSSTLLNKHAAHVWSKIMELTWTPPAPPIFSYVNKSLAGKWASLACHETGSLVVQTAFEQCEDADKELIIGELLDEEAFSDVVTNAWGAFCIIHLLEHGSSTHRFRAVDNLINGLSQYASHEQSIKSVLKALKEGGAEVLDRVVTRLCEAPKGGRRASLVDIALSPIGSQLIGTILPNVNKEQRNALYEAIRGHVVTLRGSRVGSKVIWLFDRMRAYYGY